jgi:hypothetical protein
MCRPRGRCAACATAPMVPLSAPSWRGSRLLTGYIILQISDLQISYSALVSSVGGDLSPRREKCLMKKITLNLNALRVDSFDIETPISGLGTVQAHSDTIVLPCQTLTCKASCGLTCSFGGTCLRPCVTTTGTNT